MQYIIYLPIIILIFVLLKYLISFVDKSTISLNKKIELSQVENGILSIKDLQKNNYNRFIDIIQLYLKNLGFKDINLYPNGNSNSTNFFCALNNEYVYVTCIQNDLIGQSPEDEDQWTKTGYPELQKMLARMTLNNCTKGILITNSSFSEDALSFVNQLHSNLNIEIKLVDGYSLTQSIRNYKNFHLKEDFISEV